MAMKKVTAKAVNAMNSSGAGNGWASKKQATKAKPVKLTPARKKGAAKNMKAGW